MDLKHHMMIKEEDIKCGYGNVKIGYDMAKIGYHMEARYGGIEKLDIKYYSDMQTLNGFCCVFVMFSHV